MYVYLLYRYVNWDPTREQKIHNTQIEATELIKIEIYNIMWVKLWLWKYGRKGTSLKCYWCFNPSSYHDDKNDCLLLLLADPQIHKKSLIFLCLPLSGNIFFQVTFYNLLRTCIVYLGWQYRWYQYNLDINNNSAAPSPLRLPATTYKQLDHDFIVKLQTEDREGSITEKAPTRAFSWLKAR